jgi:hypothetical protein
MWAAHQDHTEVVMLLVQAGIDVQSRTKVSARNENCSKLCQESGMNNTLSCTLAEGGKCPYPGHTKGQRSDDKAADRGRD